MSSEIADPSPNPSLQALEVLTGEWQMEIRWAPKLHALVGGPATVRGRVIFEWIENGRFLIQRQGVGNGTPQAHWIVGRDEPSEEYCVLYADFRSISRVYKMTLRDRVWRIWRDAPGFNQRFEGLVSVDGRSIEGCWEKAEDNETWELDFDVKYSKA